MKVLGRVIVVFLAIVGAVSIGGISYISLFGETTEYRDCLELVDASYRDRLLEKLGEQDIDLSFEGEEKFCFPSESADVVRSLLSDVGRELNPQNSIRIMGGAFARNVQELLDAEGVRYSASPTDGNRILVVADTPEDLSKVRAVMQRVVAEMIDGGSQ